MTRGEDTLISFQSVSLTYRGASVRALRDVTLDLRDGEILALLGANGSGKSTLGRLANALWLPSEGTVTVDGVVTHAPQGMVWARGRVGMVFQNPDSGIVSASVEEDVAFALENRRVPRQVMYERVERMLRLLGLDAHRQTHPLDLSTSDRARLGLAAAVIGDPRYLIMDEATAYLDPTDRASLLDAVMDVRAATGMAVVLITHLMDEALMADRVAVLSGGELVFVGTPRALFSDPPRARSWRLELPPLLQLQEELRERGVELGHEPLTLDAALEQLCRL
jgi:energy-coupling factor transport system ATP-binding protein